ncbi:hypothetical protein [Pelomicrobium methylotrophicum]|uniref:Uncharacterized protein n=1 Tax=Pelomicrobium methylotrophicum TaxID=2602750 RepID=A0A5C7EUE4_9PROT|nr:hypothetical protein [Pelomicrobium methylotrophicum]TXF11848.1 hypothetical protein FR698_08705 [Pelomicrobium methylotrophicum]
MRLEHRRVAGNDKQIPDKKAVFDEFESFRETRRRHAPWGARGKRAFLLSRPQDTAQEWIRRRAALIVDQQQHGMLLEMASPRRCEHHPGFSCHGLGKREAQQEICVMNPTACASPDFS